MHDHALHAFLFFLLEQTHLKYTHLKIYILHVHAMHATHKDQFKVLKILKILKIYGGKWRAFFD